MVALLDRCIAVLKQAEMSETAMLVGVARLDLMSRLRGVSEEELQALAFWLESELTIRDYIEPPELRSAHAG